MRLYFQRLIYLVAFGMNIDQGIGPMAFLYPHPRVYAGKGIKRWSGQDPRRAHD